MLKSVTVTNFKKESLEMELVHPEKTGLIVYNIEGIGGGKATINTTESATGDGSWYNSARAESRNIVLYAKLMPTDTLTTIEEVRHDVVYRYFPIKTSVRLTFNTTIRSVYIDGYVESNETPIFSSEEFCTISIICPDPAFRTVQNPYSMFSGIVPEFEFPFWDDSVESGGGGNPQPVFNTNLIDNFNLMSPDNTSGKTTFIDSGQTINDWFFENPSNGNAAVFSTQEGIRFQQYETNSSIIKFWNTFGSLANNATYTASYWDGTDVKTATFKVERPDNAVTYEKAFETGDTQYTAKILSDANSPIYRLEFSIVASVNKTLLLKAVKVEVGENQTLCKRDDSGAWQLITDPGPNPGTDDSATIEFGQISFDSKTIIDYKGSVSTGFNITIEITGNTNDITIYNLSSDEFITIISDKVSTITGKSFKEGDILRISTMRGNKSIVLERAEGNYNIIGAISRTSTWLQLTPGDNTFEIRTGEGSELLRATFEYTEAHMGV